MVAIPDEPVAGDDPIDAALAASGIAVTAEDATAIRNLAQYFLAQAEIVSRALSGDAGPLSGTGLPEQSG